MAENQYQWRSFIRLSEEPWLRGHTVGSTVLFPGAGIVSIVLEATQQLIDPGKTARAYRLRDVNLFAAMALPEDQATEVIIHLRPHLIATTGSTPATWWEFTVSSCVGTDQLRDNARGLVTIDYDENRSQQMVREDALSNASQIVDYHRILEECPETYSKERFYQHMTKASWSYGELFQGVENCHPGYGKTTFDIRLVDIGETFSKGQFDRPFLINAASLDAVFQSWLGATYNNGAFEFDKPFVPTAIGELEISAHIPGDADYVMPGLCRAERYGFNELSADITLFDKEFSTVFLSVKDFRTSELEMDAGRPDTDGAEVDPTDITSEVKWNNALGMLQPQELSQVVSAIATQDKVTELIRMALHANPAANVIELITDASDRASAAMSKLPEDVILPSQVHYAIVKIGGGEGDKDNAGLQILSLGENDALSPVDKASADLLVVTYHHQVQDAEKLQSLVSLACQRLAKQGAIVIVAAADEAVASGLEVKGFQIVSGIEDGKSLALYSPLDLQTETSANPPEKYEVVIIEPPIAKAAAQDFSSLLQQALQGQGYSVSTKTWGDALSPDDVKGKTYVSLLELEQSMLDKLAERDFEDVRTVVLNCERLLWVTAGDNPSFGMVDGFARCMMSEIAGIKFQLLHLSAATGLEHGPALATRILDSDSSENEYREVDGILQVARIFKSHQQNENIRYHLEDSTRVVKLADQEDALRLTIGRPGLLDTLKFVPDERMLPPLADDEVEIQVKATGLK